MTNWPSLWILCVHNNFFFCSAGKILRIPVESQEIGTISQIGRLRKTFEILQFVEDSAIYLVKKGFHIWRFGAEYFFNEKNQKNLSSGTPFFWPSRFILYNCLNYLYEYNICLFIINWLTINLSIFEIFIFWNNCNLYHPIMKELQFLYI